MSLTTLVLTEQSPTTMRICWNSARTLDKTTLIKLGSLTSLKRLNCSERKVSNSVKKQSDAVKLRLHIYKRRISNWRASIPGSPGNKRSHSHSLPLFLARLSYSITLTTGIVISNVLMYQIYSGVYGRWTVKSAHKSWSSSGIFNCIRLSCYEEVFTTKCS